MRAPAVLSSRYIALGIIFLNLQPDGARQWITGDFSMENAATKNIAPISTICTRRFNSIIEILFASDILLLPALYLCTVP